MIKHMIFPKLIISYFYFNFFTFSFYCRFLWIRSTLLLMFEQVLDKYLANEYLNILVIFKIQFINK